MLRLRLPLIHFGAFEIVTNPHDIAPLNCDYNCDGHTFISFIFPQFISFHSVFHTFHGLMNSLNWPALTVWVFIAQLVEHCNANAEATGSNPDEALKNFFRATSQLLKLRFNCDGQIFISSCILLGLECR